MKKERIAHISEDGRIQTVEQHCYNVAKIASQKAKISNLENTLYILGLLHDIGKCSKSFQKYIKDENAIRGSVNHTTAGARFIVENLKDYPWQKEVFAGVLMSHHGLIDYIKEDGYTSGYKNKLNYEIEYEEIKKESKWIYTEDFNKKLSLAVQEIKAYYTKISTIKQNSHQEYFYRALLIRLILSYLIDADWEDTTNFMDNKVYKSSLEENKKEIINDFYTNIEKEAIKLRKLKTNLTEKEVEINNARTDISEKSKIFAWASLEPQLAKLPTPTGSGKTISSVRYGISRIKNTNKSKVIYFAPYLSILEDNASKLKKIFNNSPYITEFHSNAENNKDNKDIEYNKKENLFSNDLNNFLILTTTYRLIETIISSNLKAVRRFHSLVNSVLLIDEPQKIPYKTTTFVNLTLNFLTYICNTDTLLMTATVPPFDKEEISPNRLLYTSPKEIVNCNEYYDLFEKVDYIDVSEKAMNASEFSDFILNNYDKNALIVLNTKKAVRNLCRELQQKTEKEVIQLTKYMCAKDILDTIEYVKSKDVICVSTNLVEAGVDFSFKTVFRSAIGLDSIIQTAGRCNRNGEFKIGKTFIVNYKDENIKTLKDVKESQNSFYESIHNCFENIASLQAQEAFFDWLYSIKDLDYSDGYTSLYELMSANRKRNDSYNKDQKHRSAMRYVGNHFEIYEADITNTVYVPYDKAEKLIKELESSTNIKKQQMLINQLQQYSVNIYRTDNEIDFDEMIALGKFKLIEGFDDLYIADKECYTPQYGLHKTKNYIMI